MLRVNGAVSHAKERLAEMTEIFREESERMERYSVRVKELYRGWLPFKIAAKRETRAYWRARLQAWDECYLLSPYTTPKTLRLRDEMREWHRL